MFHTVLLFKKLQGNEYSALFKTLRLYSQKNNERYYEDSKCEGLYIFQLFRKSGMIIFLRYKEINGFHYHYIEIRMNPKILIENNNYVDVTKQEDYKKILKAFKNLFKPIRKQFQKIRKYKYLKFMYDSLDYYEVKRIDYCVNIKVPYSEMLIKLIQRSNVPDTFKIVEIYDEKSKRMKSYESSFYIRNKSVCINCYDKKFQLLHEFSSYSDIEQAENIIRFEVQCYSTKTNNLKAKYKFKTKSMLNYITYEVCEDILRKYYNKTIGCGDYYTLQEARKIINDKNFRLDTKQRMIEVLNLINQKRNVSKAKEEYKNNFGTKKEFNTILKKINEIGINPVTIPISWGIACLPNLINGIDKELMPIGIEW